VFAWQGDVRRRSDGPGRWRAGGRPAVRADRRP